MRWLIVMYLIASTVTTLEGFEGSLKNLKYVPALGIAIIAIIVRKDVFVLPKDNVLNTIFLFLIASGLISVAFNPGGDTLLYYIFMPINLIIFGYMRRYGITRQQLLVILIFFAICSFFPRYYKATSSHTGLFNNPNGLAPILALMFYLVIILKRIPILYKVAAGLILFWFVLLTESRAGLIGYLIFVLAYLFQTWVRFNFKFLSYVVLLIGIGVYGWMLETKTLTLIETANNVTQSEKQSGFSERDMLYDIFSRKIMTTPEGIGFGRSGEYTKQVTGENGYSPHNMYLKAAVEGGWLFMAMFWVLFTYLYFTSKSIAANSFAFAYYIRCLFESATPFTMSIVSVLLFLPFFLNEHNIRYARAAFVRLDKPPHQQVGAGTA